MGRGGALGGNGRSGWNGGSGVVVVGAHHGSAVTVGEVVEDEDKHLWDRFARSIPEKRI